MHHWNSCDNLTFKLYLNLLHQGVTVVCNYESFNTVGTISATISAIYKKLAPFTIYHSMILRPGCCCSSIVPPYSPQYAVITSGLLSTSSVYRLQAPVPEVKHRGFSQIPATSFISCSIKKYCKDYICLLISLIVSIVLQSHSVYTL